MRTRRTPEAALGTVTRLTMHGIMAGTVVRAGESVNQTWTNLSTWTQKWTQIRFLAVLRG
jgi:hypothetical protein